jgi:hypothetical protein
MNMPRTLTIPRALTLSVLFLASAGSVFGTLSACTDAPAAPEAKAADDAPESVRSNYPAKVEADATAQKICESLQTLPRARKAECCQKPPGILLTSECTRVLSGAMQDGALVVAAASADACAAAMAERFDGCGWVGEWSRDLPSACTGILEGQREDGETCRSSLECEDGLTCHGVSPTDTGTCGAPGAAGAVCGRGIDPVASYVGQETMRAHPECAGFCANQRCRDLARVGDRCVSDAHCGDGNICAKEGEQKVCRAGERERPATSGDLEERCALRL